jgi:cobalt transporter subunit CbtB
MPTVLPISQAALWLSIATFLALLTYYFIGVDEGAMSVFGPNTMVVHEFVHDARHFLGFPCH